MHFNLLYLLWYLLSFLFLVLILLKYHEKTMDIIPRQWLNLGYCCFNFFTDLFNMSIRRVLSGIPRTGSKKDIPVVYHEPHVESGFRLTHQPWYYYLLSLFQVHNECMNSWTHLVGGIVVVSRIYKLVAKFDAYNDPWMYPMLAGSITMVMMYLCSSMAHTFHNKSEQLHYTCFFVDYVGIGVYGLGSTMIHHYYCTEISLMGTFAYKYSIPVAVVLSVIVAIFCSYSKCKYRRPYPFARKIYQLSSVLSIYAWLIIPIVHRLYSYSLHQRKDEWEVSLQHHTEQIFWFFAAGIFFGLDVPQRFFPGKCDFLFHGHQIFHVCITFTNLKQIDGMQGDIESRLSLLKEHAEIPTFWSTFGPILFSICFNILVVVYFHFRAKQRIYNESKTAVKFE